ncbi:adenylosuccinate lyase [Amphibacillus marinus]|uniref:Adenylosuccinate lyase n=1 Tax=Amphibacillus marinus TaxID=872970 RepID=A0A1H8QHM9_9BACI|nr:adenylosuccinate lyase family protein [Amphibacillus marinus]SEO53303.1 adenylosuccinate lyase [Amphibacillus marinus]
MRALYDSKSFSINDRGIKQLLTKEYKYQSWLDVETALAQAQADFDVIPKQAAADIKVAAKIENIDFNEMNRIYREIGHVFVPFLKVLVKACPEESGKYVHYGVTTQNIQQTAQFYTVKQVHKKFKCILSDSLKNLANLADKHKKTVMPGRTHGRHATPITYGYKASVWISELIDGIDRLIESEKRVFAVMMGGAVGTFSTAPEHGRQVQKRVAELLGMSEMRVPSRSIHTPKIEYLMNLSLLCNVCNKMAEEVYYTSLEEIGEVAEGFKEGTVGSSTMPHKINPKLAKGIIANSQKLYSLLNPLLHSATRMFEGDSSTYLLFDGVIEEAIQLTTEILLRFEELTGTITIHDARMQKNAWLNKGLDNSEWLMMKVAEKLGKDQAHELIYKIAIRTSAYNEDFLTNLLEDPYIANHFTKAELEELISPASYTGLATEIAEDMALLANRYANKLLAD